MLGNRENEMIACSARALKPWHCKVPMGLQPATLE